MNIVDGSERLFVPQVAVIESSGVRRTDARDEFERDADRLLYSSNFRRLSGVTQVISPGDDFVHHDRLTHSLKVAQVGRRIASGLGGKINPEVVYAAGLAHDIGHPPFGHAAEQELMHILDGRIDELGHTTTTVPLAILPDSFEGNAQSFRIVAKNAARKEPERGYGLNLTVRTLAAIQKYPWVRNKAGGIYGELGLDRTKWGAYESEKPALERTLVVAGDAGVMGPTRSVEADVMDWADDISYAVHDTEDFYRAGLIPLHSLKTNHDLWMSFLPWAQAQIDDMRIRLWDYTQADFDYVAAELWDVLPSEAYSGNQISREALHLFGSSSIDRLSRNLFVSDQGELKVPDHSRLRVEILKKITRYFVIDRAELQLVQHGQRRTVRDLFFGLRQIAFDCKDPAIGLPGRFADYLEGAKRDATYVDTARAVSRATVDYICSLTDKQAMAMADQLAGRTLRTPAGIASI